MALKDAGWMPDHVHLLVSLSREYSVSNAVRLIKSNSSKWIHETFAELASFGWQAGYGAFSVSRSNEDQLKKYLANQKEHHRVHTFQEEFREFLRKHEIDWDERYVWD